MRKISEIAADIRKAWPKPYFGAVPYLQAMHQIELPTDIYIAETGAYIVLGFLSNASSFRGDAARKLKAELNAIIKEH